MNTPYIAEFRKRLSAAHRRKISNSLKRRSPGGNEAGDRFDKNVLRVTHLTNSANNATKAYYNVARGAKDFQLVRKYNQAMRPASKLQKLGAGLDSTLRRGESGSRITSRLSLIPLRFPRNIERTRLRIPDGDGFKEVVTTVSRMARIF